MPEQVQDFYPTPSTISTCMYYTGVDPRTMKEVYVPSSPHEKAMQRALIQYRNPDNYELVKEALLKAGRADLIGFDKDCLIRPRKMGGKSDKSGKQNSGRQADKNSQKTKGKTGHVTYEKRTEIKRNEGGKVNNKVNYKVNNRGNSKKSIRNIHKKKQK
jgi:hypothetical protein